MTLGTLPQEFSASIPTPHTDVGIKIKDGVVGNADISTHQRGIEVESHQCSPDRLVDSEGVRVVDQ